LPCQPTGSTAARIVIRRPLPNAATALRGGWPSMASWAPSSSPNSQKPATVPCIGKTGLPSSATGVSRFDSAAPAEVVARRAKAPGRNNFTVSEGDSPQFVFPLPLTSTVCGVRVHWRVPSARPTDIVRGGSTSSRSGEACSAVRSRTSGYAICASTAVPAISRAARRLWSVWSERPVAGSVLENHAAHRNYPNDHNRFVSPESPESPVSQQSIAFDSPIKMALSGCVGAGRV